jgi:hypothetical protein
VIARILLEEQILLGHLKTVTHDLDRRSSRPLASRWVTVTMGSAGELGVSR